MEPKWVLEDNGFFTANCQLRSITASSWQIRGQLLASGGPSIQYYTWKLCYGSSSDYLEIVCFSSLVSVSVPMRVLMLGFKSLKILNENRNGLQFLQT